MACHVGKPEEVRLRNADDYNQLCNNCHEADMISSYVHAVGMVPPQDFLARMPKEFKDAVARGGGKVTCISCHDLTIQCKTERFEQVALNKLFFRGGVYSARTDLCFQCHDAKRYERFNPHDQISDEGVLDTQTCYVCHSVTPNRKTAKSIRDVQFNVMQELTQLCTGCHPWRMHPGGMWAGFAKGSHGEGPNHLVVPPDYVLQRIKEQEQAIGVMMPLDPHSGRIFCATCHNPHERGVQWQPAADKGADGYKRLRKGEFQICNTCHAK